MSRSNPAIECLKGFDHIAGNYSQDEFSPSDFSGFDSMVFAAGADIRQFNPTEDEAEFYERVNIRGVPRFFEIARDAGISRTVYIGTFYPQAAPETIDRSIYVRSRYLADEALRGLNSDDFTVCSLNAPFILGYVPGMDLPHLAAIVQYAAGRLEGLPIVAPGGGVNHISSKSMSEAIEGALHRGEGGKAYLVGDENLSWKDYLQMYFEEVGNPTDLEVSEQEHPLFPDVMLYAGRNKFVSYEPDNGALNYSRNNIRATVAEVVKAYL